MIQPHLISLSVRPYMDFILHRSIRKSILSNPFLKPWVNPEDMRRDLLTRIDKASQEHQFANQIQIAHMIIAQVRQTVIAYHKKMTGPYGWTVNFSKLSHLPGKPDSIEGWIDYHESVDLLPFDEKFVFKMIAYGDFTVENLSKELGICGLSTEYCWVSAQNRLQEYVFKNKSLIVRFHLIISFIKDA